MAQRKLKHLRVFNAIKCGGREDTFFTSEGFDITLEETLMIRIENRKGGQRVYTSLFNVTFWDFDDDAKAEVTELAEKRGPGRPSRKAD